ncbi:hypothetical protein J6590_083229 [Homalodisca vitripennis]|nr:hypothetical protein J6590_083229 [Homalodisca vitripennis]
MISFSIVAIQRQLPHKLPSPPLVTEISTEDIMLVLQEHTDNQESLTNLETLTAKTIREWLEAKLNVDLSGREKQIDQVLKACQTLDESILPDNPPTTEPDAPSSIPKINLRPKKKKSIPFTKSDDERDEDFNPWQEAKKKKGKKRK